MTNLKVGDIVSWDGTSWTVMDCGHMQEPLADGTLGGWLTDIENDTSGVFAVLCSVWYKSESYVWCFIYF